jgi:hypothetical protein
MAMKQKYFVRIFKAHLPFFKILCILNRNLELNQGILFLVLVLRVRATEIFFPSEGQKIPLPCLSPMTNEFFLTGGIIIS